MVLCPPIVSGFDGGFERRTHTYDDDIFVYVLLATSSTSGKFSGLFGILPGPKRGEGIALVSL